jgi:ferritin-like metal-binding protein YciE
MSSIAATERLIYWLQSAYAMEEESLQLLVHIHERVENYHDLKAKIAQHIEETDGQKKLLAGCLERLQSSPSTLENFSAKISALSHRFAEDGTDDEIIRDIADCYTFEQQEIVRYIIIIEAAKTIGDHDTLGIAELILKQEVAMANWLLDHTPQITFAFLSRSTANPETANR